MSLSAEQEQMEAHGADDVEEQIEAHGADDVEEQIEAPGTENTYVEEQTEAPGTENKSEEAFRVRPLTEKGEEQFYEQYVYLNKKQESCWRDIEAILTELAEGSPGIKALHKLQADAERITSRFKRSARDLVEFLHKTRTNKSNEILERYNENLARRTRIIDRIPTNIETALLNAAEQLSEAGSNSTRNSSSSLVKKKLMAERERTKLQMIQEKIDLQYQRAKIEGKMQILDQREMSAIADAELKVLEEEEHNSHQEDICEDEPVDKVQDVANYITSLPLTDREADHTNHPATYGATIHLSPKTQSSTSLQATTRALHLPTYTSPPLTVAPTTTLRNPQVPVVTSTSLLRPMAAPFISLSTTPAVATTCALPNPLPTIHPGASNDQLNALSNFLMKKELLITRFTAFTDEPEAYNAWKINFQSVVRELTISQYEALQLLVRWLGPESSKFAANIRQAHIDNPSEGVQAIWSRLDERYGAAELIDSALKTKLARFPSLTIKDGKKLFELSDLLSQMEGVKKNPKYAATMSYYDSSVGIVPIVNKLPYQWREKWTNHASNYKAKQYAPYPPFDVFVRFIQDLSRVRNDPGFQYEEISSWRPARRRELGSVVSRKTQMEDGRYQKNNDMKKCPLHDELHSVKRCRKFRTLPLPTRKKILKDNNLCYRCCDGSHMARDCKSSVRCETCSSTAHHSALHPQTHNGGEQTDRPQNNQLHKQHSREQTNKPCSQNYHSRDQANPSPINTTVGNMCTRICGNNFRGKSCAKTVLVSVYPKGHKEECRRVYAILDDQSSQTLAKPQFFDMFSIHGETITYTLSSCSGSITTTGRCAKDLIVEPVFDGYPIPINRVIECVDIPSNREEIPTPNVALAYPHLSGLAAEIPQLDDNAEILLLIGRDHADAHHVLSQRTGPSGSPFAQKLPLGWAIIGETCLGRVHRPEFMVANKTHILQNGQSTFFQPCPAYLKVEECMNLDYDKEINTDPLFERTKEDEQPGLSVEDREFLHIMDTECIRDDDGHWTAPLPFKRERERLPDNREQAMKRTRSFLASCKKNTNKLEHAIAFMDKVLKSGHAEEAKELDDHEERWYLPIFGVYHPRKPNQIRMVFDSSASYRGTSLNSVLLSGPDQTNSLLGILLRFRKESVAVAGDIEQMFHSFKIREDHRNFVRFIWYEDNEPNKPLRNYRMCVHLFGNSPSPAIATYCLRKCVSDRECDTVIRNFVTKNFYVDDGLTSLASEQVALDVLLKTQTTLMENGKLRFHKFVSNSQAVMDALPTRDRCKDLSIVDLELGSAPPQRSLGINWNLLSDNFLFNINHKHSATTKRGILSCLNSLFDPIGFLSPVILRGRFIFRDTSKSSLGWDEPVPPEIEKRWREWYTSLQCLSDITIPRTYLPVSLATTSKRELHVFSDASEKAVCSVAYLRATSDNKIYTGFVMGKSKLSPSHGHTIPRLELCAAVMTTDLAAFIIRQLDIQIDRVVFYTDSRVVLGYIFNKTRRFHTYVANRTQRILLNSSPDQWHYVPSEENPADIGTRSVIASELQESTWLSGPIALHCKETCPGNVEEYPLMNPDCDKEVRLETKKTEVTSSLGLSRFERFSSWTSVLRGLLRIRRFALKKQACQTGKDASALKAVETFLLKTLQEETYPQELLNLATKKPVPKNSPLRYLDAYLDDEGVIRVGGRIRIGDILSGKDGPIVVPGRAHLARLLAFQLHETVKHQGRNITEGAVRSAGYWVIGGKRLVSSIIHSCVTCRRLRRPLEFQKMADVPEMATKPTAPFTYVGIDTFGPWEITTRKTRGGAAQSKRWAILFTCLTCRAVHIELVEDMSSAACINAIRRFVALRGMVKQYHSDRGTNFVGSTDALGAEAVNVEDATIKGFLNKNGSTWVFNPPHASHMGGAWERMIGTARRILEAILLKEVKQNLTHDVLQTLMCEVCAIINSRPISPVSTDPSQPSVLSPSVLLTQKIDTEVGPFEDVEIKDAYRSHWKYVQLLANQFWKRWQNEYLHGLQMRRKWTEGTRDILCGDIVLLKETDCVRYEWPLGVITRTFASTDSKVRKVEVRVSKMGRVVEYVRPVTQIVHLFTP